MLAQNQVINYLLNSKDKSFIINNNLSDDFFSDYPTEFKYLLDYISRYNTLPDKETFLAKFSNFDVVLVTETPQALLDGLYEDYKKRNLASVFNNVRTLLNKGDTDGAQKAFLDAAAKVMTISQVRSVDLFQDLSRYDIYLDKATHFNDYYVSTGFPELDQVIGGWDRKEEYATIVARTNQGKSWLLLKTAITAADNGLKVGLYSGEMTPAKVGYRIDTLISHLSNGMLIHGNLDIQHEYKRFLETAQKKYAGRLLVRTPKEIGHLANIRDLESFIETDHLDMLCIDQHSLMEDINHSRSPVEAAANISKAIKSLQVQKKIPIIMVAQQNRNSTENGIDTTHVAGTDRIPQDSTVVIFFEQKDGVLTLHLSKSRDSQNGKDLKYAINLDRGIFTFIPNEDDATGGAACDSLRNEFEAEENMRETVF